MEKPKGMGPLPKMLLVIAFLLSWLALIALMLRSLEKIWPAMTVLDPASVAAGALLIPMAVFLLQAMIYLPRRQSRPIFLRTRTLTSFSIIVLPTIKRLEPGPALDLICTPADRQAIVAEASRNSQYAYRLIPRLALLLDNRSPLEVLLSSLMRSRLRPVSALGWLLFLVVGPPRQFMRLWGYVFTRLRVDPGPAEELLAYKRKVAYDLAKRGERFGIGRMNFAESKKLLARIWHELKRVHNNPFYGQDVGEPLPDLPESGEAPNGAVAEYYSASWMAPRYYGVYLDLSVTLAARTFAEMYDSWRDEDTSVFYPPELGQEVEAASWLLADRARLQKNLAERREEGVATLDGRPIPTWTIEAWLFDIEGDLNYYKQRIAAHHRRCRTAHLMRARRLERGWPEYLRGLAGLLHFAEHARRALCTRKNDFEQLMRGPEKFSGETAAEAARLHNLMADLHDRVIHLDLTDEVEVRPPDMLPLALASPVMDLNAWLEAWAEEHEKLVALLSALRDKALSALLWGEDQVSGRLGEEPGSAPPAPGPIADFTSIRPPVNVPERVYSMAERLKIGFGHSLLATLFLALLLWQSQTLGRSNVVVYNGLGRDVTVWVGDEEARVRPYGRALLKLQPGKVYTVTSSTGELPRESYEQPFEENSPEALRVRSHLIEHFTRQLSPTPATEVYNIAGAAPLMQWRSPRRMAGDAADEFLGRPRWLKTEADVLFRAPSPREAQQEEQEKISHLVLSAYGELPPSEMLPAFSEERDQAELIYIHALWDKPGTSGFWPWQFIALGPSQAEILIERLTREPDFLDRCIQQLDLLGIQ